jgi:Ca2+-binding EF-hand superfamily protein
MFDIDKNGTIDLNELKQIIGDGNTTGILDESIIANAIKEVDLKGDGKINLDEFIIMMSK